MVVLIALCLGVEFLCFLAPYVRFHIFRKDWVIEWLPIWKISSHLA